MTTEELQLVLLASAGVLLVAVAAVRLAARTGLPSLLLYVGLGLVIGEDGLGLHFDNFRLAEQLGYVALVVILAEGGLTTRWSRIRPSVAPAAVLATVGVALSVVVTALATYAVLDVSWRVALLAGALLAPTDAAAVFSVLRRVPLPARISGILEAESGFNDAPVVILVVALTSDTGSSPSLLAVVGLVVLELAIGTAVGLGVGLAGVELVRRIALPAAGLYPVAVTALAVLAYAAAAVLHGSGFLAVYLAGLVLGNARLPHRLAVRSFVEGAAWLAQIGLFVMLGLLATPSKLGSALLPALVVGLALVVLARPISVVACALPFRIPWREQAFLSWAGLRGAVPIVLAAVPISAGEPEGQRLFGVVFVLVVVFTLVQAPTLPWTATRLGVAVTGQAQDLDVDALPLDRLGADVLSLSVPAGSELHGVEVFELRLPPGAVVSLIVRDGEKIVPTTRTRIERGDELLLVVPAARREDVEQRMRAISRAGRLAGWLGERGESETEPERPARPAGAATAGPETGRRRAGNGERAGAVLRRRGRRPPVSGSGPPTS